MYKKINFFLMKIVDNIKIHNNKILVFWILILRFVMLDIHIVALHVICSYVDKK